MAALPKRIASSLVQSMDSFNEVVPNSQQKAQSDFFFDGTDNNSTTNTNVSEMFLEGGIRRGGNSTGTGPNVINLGGN